MKSNQEILDPENFNEDEKEYIKLWGLILEEVKRIATEMKAEGRDITIEVPEDGPIDEEVLLNWAIKLKGKGHVAPLGVAVRGLQYRKEQIDSWRVEQLDALIQSKIEELRSTQ